MKNLTIIIVSLVIFAACSKNDQFKTPDEMVEHALKTVQLIKSEALHELMENYEVYTLVDVRQELEHYRGYIPGSVNIPRGSLEFNIADPDFWDAAGLYEPEKDELIILYCHKGQRSTLSAVSLRQLGYKNVRVIDGGYKKWELTYPDIYEKDLDKLSGQDSKPKKSGAC
jgi:rhodanese-related sulfurtransferase